MVEVRCVREEGECVEEPYSERCHPCLVDYCEWLVDRVEDLECEEQDLLEQLDGALSAVGELQDEVSKLEEELNDRANR